MLDTAEGSGLAGGNRRQRYATALGSALEVRACFDVAVSLEYIPGIDETLHARLREVIGTLTRVAR